MPGFGPFPSRQDALMAACPRILGLPNAIAGRPDSPNFELHWRTSSEYCAWIYRTPDGMYEMSMLAVSAVQDDARRRQCSLPSTVSDPRYRAEDIQYMFVIHNHPYEGEISRNDIRFIVEQGAVHGFSAKAEDRQVPLSIVAFYSRSERGNPTCDGFFQYIPLTRQLLKWSVGDGGTWKDEEYGRVEWVGDDFDILYEER
ncbi:hypothetical protein [Melittangium boletus]|uniref:hypothetical protein n=1 Tax=Melittangium boletus TaxID=83453 RepID=UPI003DA52E27